MARSAQALDHSPKRCTDCGPSGSLDQDEPFEPVWGNTPQFQGHGAAQRVPGDEGPFDLELIQDVDDGSGQPCHGVAPGRLA